MVRLVEVRYQQVLVQVNRVMTEEERLNPESLWPMAGDREGESDTAVNWAVCQSAYLCQDGSEEEQLCTDSTGSPEQPGRGVEGDSLQ